MRIVPLLRDGAVLLAGAGAVEVAFWWVPSEQGPPAGGFVGVLLLAAPLLWRRKAPALSGAAAALVWLGWSLLSPPQGSFLPWLLQLLALYAVGARAPEREAVLVLALWIGADAVFVASTTGALADYVFVYGIGGALWLAGSVAARRQRTAVLAETRAAELERSRQREIEHAMAQERARIARELHDVVAHTVSVMVVQAAAAEQVLERAPAAARQSLHAVQTVGRQALDEMRRMLCVLREDDIGTPMSPSPRLNGLAELVEVARAAGLTVELDVHGDLDSLPDGVSLCAYRVVQEALTNTMRHARARTACVGVRRTPGLLVLEVCDDGTAAVPGGTADRPGHGLLGMRERVHVFGGQLEHGPAGGGGYRVYARLPLDGQAP